jgi:hypothetical protein
MTKREKTWFFPLCGYQPKINKLIFLVYFLVILAEQVRPGVCHQSQRLPMGAFLRSLPSGSVIL